MLNELLEIGVDRNNVFMPDINARWIYSDKQYFDKSVFSPLDGEIFVDAGAYNMQTSKKFSEWCPSYKWIYAFEPDDKQYKISEKQKEYLNIRDVDLINAGLWSRTGIARFCHEDTGGSQISDFGDNTINVISLDEYLEGRKVTYIKMDIEGAETEALIGAKNTIVKWRPKLAICIYHKIEDLTDILLFLKEWVPDYKFKMRHYSTYLWETVLYAYIKN